MSHACPCQSGKTFADCCKPLLTNQKRPATAEQLMRSRYTAYYRSDWKYLYRTWHKTCRPSFEELRAGDDDIEWLGLKIVDLVQGKSGDTHGIVEFVATYKSGAAISQLRERSLFVCENGQWLYLHADSHENSHE